ncbi:hypothetical protein KP509_09G029000 [Ceratopteris richardii]|nr:hypothetical protein KP509_09G029000 [Ceratopteris richardii]KAH7429065.1 hypothetical protein KP509_09G029000 [Ceratopteris richardii]
MYKLNGDVSSLQSTGPMTESLNNVLLLLVGLPGSGKSTFCNKLMQSSPQKWKRICQDIISNGKRGTKDQCLKEAEKALCQGFNVMIDRCNLTIKQRQEFLQLATRISAQVHALILDIPVKICIQRAMQRIGHEGGLEGKHAPAAVQRMAQTLERPAEVEGFTSIFTCCTADDIERAFCMYHLDTQGDHRNNDNDKNVSGNVTGERVCGTSLGSNKYCTHDDIRKAFSTHQLDTQQDYRNNDKRVPGKLNSETEYGDNFSSINSSDAGFRTLAFPSISTSDFQFDHEKAADIIVDVASNFLQEFKGLGLRLVFVDLKENSDMLTRVRQKSTALGMRSEEFMVIAGDITKLRSSSKLECSFIANATNWRLRPGGGGVNAAIFNAAGEGLEIETKKRVKTLAPGSALTVPLPASSPLYMNEGVTHIIHVLGPNMNPQRPNCLQGNYVEGSKLLRDAYSCMFRAFASCVESQSDQPVNQITNPCKSKDKQNAFTILMQSAKRKSWTVDNSMKAKHHRQTTGQQEAESSMKSISAGESDDTFHKLELDGAKSTAESQGRSIISKGEIQRPSLSTGVSKVKQGDAWTEALRNIALHPEHYQNMTLKVTDQAVVINDKFPKARKHLLVLSRMDGLDSIKDLRSSHLALLYHMQSLGMEFVQAFLKEDISLVFRMGYHLDPSMRQLHMHIMSQDFDSPSLKNKKHWNSFTSTFFRDSKGVIEEIEKMGRVQPVDDESSLLTMELRCHRCRSVQPNIPRLKKHIHTCQQPFPAGLLQKGFLIMADNENGKK